MFYALLKLDGHKSGRVCILTTNDKSGNLSCVTSVVSTICDYIIANRQCLWLINLLLPQQLRQLCAGALLAWSGHLMPAL